jgi:hypothetical protein
MVVGRGAVTAWTPGSRKKSTVCGDRRSHRGNHFNRNVGVALGGFPKSISPAEIEIEVASYLSYDQSRDYRQGLCFVVDDVGNLNENCLNPVDGRKNYLLIGDSFAADLWRGLTSVFPKVNFMQATGGGCRPTLAQAASIDPRQRRCANLMNQIFSDFLSNNKVDALLLAGAWRAMR